MVENEFIKYEEALLLKKLGFDKPCFGYYNDLKNFVEDKGVTNSNCRKPGMHGKYCAAPLYQQAFEFFRNNYLLDGTVDCYYQESFYAVIKNMSFPSIYSVADIRIDSIFINYETAKLACLKKLIEIVEEKI